MMDTDYQELGQHGVNRRRKTILGISISIMLVGLVAMPIIMQNASKKPTTMTARTESGPMLAPTLFSAPKSFGERAITEDLSTQIVAQNHTQAKANADDAKTKTPKALSSLLEPEYYWSSRGRGPQTNSFTSHTAPNTFSTGPMWVWQNDFKEQVRHSPLIDANFDIYVCTTTRLRKFDSDGQLLWIWHAAPGQIMSTSPALDRGSVYVLPCDLSQRPTAVSIDMTTGRVNWQRAYDGILHGLEASAILVHKGIIYFGGHTPNANGTDTVYAANASDGSVMWEYVTEEIMWNFSPSTPGDGSVLFSSMCGAVFRISSEGKLLWKAGTSHPYKTCVPAGGALGPNGIFYAEYNEDETLPMSFGVNSNNTLAAYNVTDGSLVWRYSLPYRAAQYPAVGKLGPGGPLAVVAALGDNPMPPMPELQESAMLSAIGGSERNMVLALDAGTGELLWESEERPYPSVVGAGELDEHNATDGPVCWPDAQGIPVISGDGTVYTSSSHHGDLRAIKDSNNDGVISPSEVSTFETGKCFLNSPSIAPGMLVAAPCWGPMYVFKN